jgi:hypothetical protein
MSVVIKDIVAKINQKLKESREPIKADDIQALIEAAHDEVVAEGWNSFRRAGFTENEIFSIMFKTRASHSTLALRHLRLRTTQMNS